MTWLFFGLVAIVLILAFIVKAQKSGTAQAASFPYIKRHTLVTPAERSFLGVLEQAVGDTYRIYVQVRLADLMNIKPGTAKSARTAAQNRINAKHADFVLCQSDTLEILCAIELDDASHQKASRKERDRFLEAACASAGLPLLRFTAKASYAIQEIRASISDVLGSVEEAPKTDSAPSPIEPTKMHSTDAPSCPKCGGATVLRTVKAGAHAGNKLWGCKTFPACRGFIPLKA
ncbi:MAG: DUF2726 domain-containing protein [Moraxellaceae bacterium]